MDGSIEGSIISVPDGPTLTGHEISTLSFTQAFAIYKVPLQMAWCILNVWARLRDALDTSCSGTAELKVASLHTQGSMQ